MRNVTIRVPKFRYIGIVLGLTIIVAACGSSSNTQTLQSDTQLMARQLSQYQTVQPRHFYQYSQDVAAMNEIMDARTAGKSTFTLFFNYGVPDPYFMCPSRGFPIPGDTELTNPDQLITYSGSSAYWGITLPQIDPNGVYTSHGTNSTYVLCIAPNGTLYTKYAEPLADAYPFPVTWNYQLHRAEMAGDPSFSVPYDESKANQLPLNVVPDSNGGYTLTNPQGTAVGRIGGPTPTPTR